MRKAIKWPLWGIAGSVLFGLAPVGVTMLAAGIASANNCRLHEGFANPCLLAGVDFGETLYSMGVFSWFALITLPVGGVTALLFLVWLVIEAVTSKSGR